MTMIRDLLDAVIGHALASGYFQVVAGHEPKFRNPAVDGVTCAVWVQRVTAIGATSGLASTSVRVELTVRIYTGMLTEPGDDIDPRVIDALDGLMAAYTGDFTLGGLVQEIDLHGAYGAPLTATAGYVAQAAQFFRVVDIALPLVVDDLWAQHPTTPGGTP